VEACRGYALRLLAIPVITLSTATKQRPVASHSWQRR